MTRQAGRPVSPASSRASKAPTPCAVVSNATSRAFPALGFKSGPILYFPSLLVEGVATDNVRNAHARRIADIGLKLAPSLIVESDWVRHAFRFSGSAERIFYADQSEFDPTAADAEGRLRLDLKGGAAVELEADYDLSEMSAGADEVPRSAVGLRRDQAFAGGSTLIHDIGRIDLRSQGRHPCLLSTRDVAWPVAAPRATATATTSSRNCR